MILDTEPASGNHSPAVALDQLANPHVAWLARVGSRDVVYYVARLASQWLDPVPLVPASDERSSADAVSIAVGPDNRPWIAWQGGTGNRINIYCAELSAATGEFIIHRLTPDAINYNLSPSIQFEGNTPIVYWYTAQNADFSLIGARYELEMSEWKVFVPENLDLLPSNRLPLLFQYPPSKLAAVWYDEIALQERVLLGLQHPTQLGAGVIIDHRPRAVNHPVSATYSTGDFVAVWCSTDEATSRPQIFLTYGDQLPVQRDDLRLSDGNSRGFYTSPALAPFHGGVAVTYTSDSTLGGDGSVLFQRVILHP